MATKELQKLQKLDWHALEKNQVLQALDSTVNGLNNDEAQKRISVYGPNEIRKIKHESSVIIFLRQLKEPLIAILLAAATISFFVGEFVDSIVIVAIVILAVIISFVQQFRSERAIEELMRMTATSIRVLRNGEQTITDARNLVPGDIILLSSGDIIPADSYLIEEFNLQTNEAPLTGESTPVRKSVGILKKETPLPERKNILYTMTTVTYGRGRAVVFSTGMDTEMGKIASGVQKIQLQKTPFEIKIRSISKLLTITMLAVVGVISVLGFLRGHGMFEMLMWALSLAVAAVPEALPAVITSSLMIGVYKMAKKNAIVRRLPVVETLGSTTVICTDKTGTLTKGQMTVRRIYLYGKYADVSGVGYSLEGKITDSDLNGDDLSLLAKTACLCNDAEVKIHDHTITAIGDPTEVALVVFGQKAGLVKEKLDSEFPRVFEIPFTSERKKMTTVHSGYQILEAFSKGATEIILAQCNTIRINGDTVTLDEKISQKILEANNEMASYGLRVLAFSHKILRKDEISSEQIEQGHTLLGLVGMLDPPRIEVIDAISQCKDAGIDVVMITGDHKLTAMAVGKEIGIISQKSKTLSGSELDHIEAEQLEKDVEDIKVYSRVSPENKIKIIHALKNKGHIVAMTGDGINDAPALKTADIGIAMGITGTEVTKESASMVLADDNFATIVSAIKEGRRIFENIKKYLIYLVSANISEIFILAFAVIAGWPLPLVAKHILFINLVTDGAPAIALGLEPSEKEVMKSKPRDPKESIFFGTKRWMIGIPIVLSVVVLSSFWFLLETNGWESDYSIDKARTMIFGLIIFFELFFSLSCKSLKHKVINRRILNNKLLTLSLIIESIIILVIMNYSPAQEVFGLVPLDVAEWVVMLALATSGFAYSELVKIKTKKSLKTTR
ncbi:MAG TPA: cation-translocating P-type ATPase [Candidatus Nitrosotenuis sp.]|nr:cation-translocating P-type ATPase [Candidatus Nitrosotenuis sp.]